MTEVFTKSKARSIGHIIIKIVHEDINYYISKIIEDVKKNNRIVLNLYIFLHLPRLPTGPSRISPAPIIADEYKYSFFSSFSDKVSIYPP